jgi:3-phosphoglycerate kinase
MLSGCWQKRREPFCLSTLVLADAFAEDAETRIAGCEEIPDDMMGLDIGPASTELFTRGLLAKTHLLNGRWASSR